VAVSFIGGRNRINYTCLCKPGITPPPFYLYCVIFSSDFPLFNVFLSNSIYNLMITAAYIFRPTTHTMPYMRFLGLVSWFINTHSDDKNDIAKNRVSLMYIKVIQVYMYGRPVCNLFIY
jgi:hypothetical protein